MLSGERGGDASKGADILEESGLFAFGHGRYLRSTRYRCYEADVRLDMRTGASGYLHSGLHHLHAMRYLI